MRFIVSFIVLVAFPACRHLTEATLACGQSGDCVVAGHVCCAVVARCMAQTECANIDGGIDAGGDGGVATPDSGPASWPVLVGTTVADVANAVAVDSSGNVYVVGETAGVLGGASDGGLDAFVTKLSPTGAHTWTRQFGTPGTDRARGVALDSNGSVFVAGETGGGLDGNPYGGGGDIFLARFTTDGAKVWTHQYGNSDSNFATAVATFGASIYVAGTTSNGLDGQGTLGNSDAFVTRFDADGGRLWTTLVGSADTDYGLGVAIGAADAIYLVGSTLEGVEGNVNQGYEDAFVAKLSSSGAKTWVRQFGSSKADVARGVAASAGGAYVVGVTLGGADGGVAIGETDLFVVKYDSWGGWQWIARRGLTGVDAGANAVAIDPITENVYVAGEATGSLDDAGALQPGATRQAVLAKFSASGAWLWTRALGPAGGEATLLGAAFSVDGGLVAAGWTTGALDGKTPAGENDAFACRFDSNGVKQ